MAFLKSRTHVHSLFSFKSQVILWDWSWQNGGTKFSKVRRLRHAVLLHANTFITMLKQSLSWTRHVVNYQRGVVFLFSPHSCSLPHYWSMTSSPSRHVHQLLQCCFERSGVGGPYQWPCFEGRNVGGATERMRGHLFGWVTAPVTTCPTHTHTKRTWFSHAVIGPTLWWVFSGVGDNISLLIVHLSVGAVWRMFHLPCWSHCRFSLIQVKLTQHYLSEASYTSFECHEPWFALPSVRTRMCFNHHLIF